MLLTYKRICCAINNIPMETPDFICTGAFLSVFICKFIPQGFISWQTHTDLRYHVYRIYIHRHIVKYCLHLSANDKRVMTNYGTPIWYQSKQKQGESPVKAYFKSWICHRLSLVEALIVFYIDRLPCWGENISILRIVVNVVMFFSWS